MLRWHVNKRYALIKKTTIVQLYRSSSISCQGLGISCVQFIVASYSFTRYQTRETCKTAQVITYYEVCFFKKIIIVSPYDNACCLTNSIRISEGPGHSTFTFARKRSAINVLLSYAIILTLYSCPFPKTRFIYTTNSNATLWKILACSRNRKYTS